MSKTPSELPATARFASLCFERTLVQVEIDDEPAIPPDASRTDQVLRSLKFREPAPDVVLPGSFQNGPEARVISLFLSPADARKLCTALEPGVLLVLREP